MPYLSGCTARPMDAGTLEKVTLALAQALEEEFNASDSTCLFDRGRLWADGDADAAALVLGLLQPAPKAFATMIT